MSGKATTLKASAHMPLPGLQQQLLTQMQAAHIKMLTC
jgi:hypothetical protein